MPRLNFQLKAYIKAVENLLSKKGFERVVVYNKSGSAVHFDLFRKGEEIPHCMWQVHTEHTKRKEITSKEDYKKGARGLNIDLEDFVKEIAKY